MYLEHTDLFFFQETTLYKLVELFQYTTPIKSQLKILAFEKDDKGIFLTFHLCVFSVSPWLKLELESYVPELYYPNYP